jgi:HSP20 family protein
MTTLIPLTRSLFPAERFFDRLFGDFDLSPIFDEEKRFVPAFDLAENEDAYVVRAEIAGIHVKDLDIQFTDGVLTVKGEKKQEKEDKLENYHRVERRYGSFQRSFRIPVNVQEDKIDANYKDGVLTLVLPKDETSRTKKIEVKH